VLASRVIELLKRQDVRASRCAKFPLLAAEALAYIRVADGEKKVRIGALRTWVMIEKLAIAGERFPKL